MSEENLDLKYSIKLAAAEQIHFLPDIESSAAATFPIGRLPEAMTTGSLPLAAFSKAWKPPGGLD